MLNATTYVDALELDKSIRFQTDTKAGAFSLN
jgi:hypothetical protein